MFAIYESEENLLLQPQAAYVGASSINPSIVMCYVCSRQIGLP